MGEFRVGIAVRHVAAGGHVEVVQLDRAEAGRVQHHAEMAAVAPAAPVRVVGADFEGQAREDGDAVVALHAAPGDVVEAERAQPRLREELVRALRLLQAEHVRLQRLDQIGDQAAAQADGVDVPGGDAELRHGAALQAPTRRGKGVPLRPCSGVTP